jgi:hypothetical protein
MSTKKLYTTEEARAHIRAFIAEQRVILERDLRAKLHSHKEDTYANV